jgi:hypothetical protein
MAEEQRNTTEQKEVASSSQVSSGNNSLVEKTTSLENGDPAATPQTTDEKIEDPLSAGVDAPASPDDLPVYPGMLTKVAVGVGLALAVFLVCYRNGTLTDR